MPSDLLHHQTSETPEQYANANNTQGLLAFCGDCVAGLEADYEEDGEHGDGEEDDGDDSRGAGERGEDNAAIVVPRLKRPKTPPALEKLAPESDPEAMKFLQQAFDEADEDNSGTLDMLEAMAMISDLVHFRKLQVRESHAKEEVKVAMLLLIPLIVFGAFVFQALEPDGMSTLDAFYFSLISISTVGLGDLVPSAGPSRWFWYVYMTMALGLVASMIHSAGNVISSAGVRMEMTAGRRERKAALRSKSSGAEP